MTTCSARGGRLDGALRPGYTTADFAVQLGWPVVIVARNRLGVLNHTLLTVEACAPAVWSWPGDPERHGRRNGPGFQHQCADAGRHLGAAAPAAGSRRGEAGAAAAQFSSPLTPAMGARMRVLRLVAACVAAAASGGCGTGVFVHRFEITVSDPSGRLGNPPFVMAVFDPRMGFSDEYARQFSGGAAPGVPFRGEYRSVEARVVFDGAPSGAWIADCGSPAGAGATPHSPSGRRRAAP